MTKQELLQSKIKEKIKKWFPWDELIGMRLGLCGFFSALSGFILEILLGWKTLGLTFLVIGFALSFVGLGLHNFMRWKYQVLIPRQIEEKERAEIKNRDLLYEKKRAWLQSIGKL